MHQALYRKYRPRKFGDVCGEDHVTSVLKYESQVSRFSHAYLFCGPRGTGKTSSAKILAKALNCEAPIDGDPCGKCDACRAIDDGNCPDVLEMDAASNNGVDYIRDIRDGVNYTPSMLKKRVYIIDEVHMLTISAFNALLKTLEEPPEHVVFILATTELHKLPATIISRCQRFDFRRIKSDVIAARLLYIAEHENIRLDETAAKIIAKQSQGGMRDAISLLELCSASGEDVTDTHVQNVLGLTGIEMLYKSAVAVARSDMAAIFNIIKKVDSSSKDISVYWFDLIGFWRDMLVVKHLPENEVSNYLDLTEPELRLLGDAARRFKSETLTYHFTLLDEALREMTRLPQTKRICAELTLIKMSDPSLSETNAALLSRISALEEKVTLFEFRPRETENTQSESNNTVKISEPAPNEHESSPAQPSSDPGDGMRPVLELGDIIERVSAQNPMCSGFLSECECYVSEDGMRVLIKTTSELAKTVLSRNDEMQSIQSALRLQKITQPGASIIIQTGAENKKSSPLDELFEEPKEF